MNEQELLGVTIFRRAAADPGAWRKPKQYEAAFQKFLDQDDNREIIIADISQILEQWFIKGVTYAENSVDSWVAGMPAYEMPREVGNMLEKIQLRIVFSILQYHRIPLALYPEILMATSAMRLSGKHEEKATFKDIVRNPIGPAIYAMWDTKDMRSAQKRARIVATNLYEIHALRCWSSFREICQKVLDEDATSKGIQGSKEAYKALEKAMVNEQRLDDIDLDTIGIIEYYAHEQGYEDTEVAMLSSELRNVAKSPEAIRKNRARIKAKLLENPEEG